MDCGWTNTGCGSFALAACRRAPSCSSATSSTHVLPVPHCTASTNSKSALGCLAPTHSRRTRASSWPRIVFSAQSCGRAEGECSAAMPAWSGHQGGREMAARLKRALLERRRRCNTSHAGSNICSWRSLLLSSPGLRARAMLFACCGLQRRLRVVAPVAIQYVARSNHQ